MDSITEIIWLLFRSAQLYDQDILVVKNDFGETGVHQIDALTTYNFQQNLVVEQLNGEFYLNFLLGMHSRLGFFTIWLRLISSDP
jgi:hypothetical protein